MIKTTAAILIATLFLCIAGCGTADAPTPLPENNQGNAPLPSPQIPAVQLPNEPVALSRIKTEFGQPLTSGLSLPDMVENALLSVVEIRTALGGGTGFIVNNDGLVVTNKHIVTGSNRVSLRLVSGASYTANVIDEHDTLDLAYLLIESNDQFTPIAVGDSDNVRVGESVIVIGFPVALALGVEPTVSQGIISARRDGRLQTDAPVNPGNSGGPVLDQFGNVVGVIVSRLEESGGRNITGIGFAIPINEVKVDLGVQVAPGRVLATPTPTPRPPIAPTIDLASTKAALDDENFFMQTKEATEYQIEQDQQEAERYAASLEATRIANRPTPTPTPLPTPTPHPSTYCREWEALVLEWIEKGNNYHYQTSPVHPKLSMSQASDFCIIAFPLGRIRWTTTPLTVGIDEGQLLPGTYQYLAPSGDDRVNATFCYLRLNIGSDDETTIELTYGEPFQFTFYAYHNKVRSICSDGALHRIGD